jgi:hypothetical protein
MTELAETGLSMPRELRADMAAFHDELNKRLDRLKAGQQEMLWALRSRSLEASK